MSVSRCGTGGRGGRDGSNANTRIAHVVAADGLVFPGAPTDPAGALLRVPDELPPSAPEAPPPATSAAINAVVGLATDDWGQVTPMTIDVPDLGWTLDFANASWADVRDDAGERLGSVNQHGPRDGSVYIGPVGPNPPLPDESGQVNWTASSPSLTPPDSEKGEWALYGSRGSWRGRK